MFIKNIWALNFEKYMSVSVDLDRNVTYIIGKNGSGKSGVGIDIVWFVLQGIAEKSSNGTIPLVGKGGIEKDDLPALITNNDR